MASRDDASHTFMNLIPHFHECRSARSLDAGSPHPVSREGSARAGTINLPAGHKGTAAAEGPLAGGKAPRKSSAGIHREHNHGGDDDGDLETGEDGTVHSGPSGFHPIPANAAPDEPIGIITIEVRAVRAPPLGVPPPGACQPAEPCTMCRNGTTVHCSL